MREITLGGFALLSSIAFSQVAYTGRTYQESFDSLESTGSHAWVNGVTLDGWFSPTHQFYTSASFYGASGLYSLGVAGQNPIGDRALSVKSNSPISLEFKFTNMTGGDLNRITIGYTGEQWREAVVSAPALFVQYFDVTQFTAIPELTFTPPKLAASGSGFSIYGNDPANRISLSHSVNLSQPIANGDTYTIRFLTVNGGFEVGFDDFNFSAEAVPEPATMTILAGAAAMAAIRRRKKS